jgi:uncharacterized protein (DUF924 family)
MPQSEGLSPATEPPWVGSVLDFWFQDLGPKFWFATEDEVDARIREKFLERHAEVLRSFVAEEAGARELLAAIIVLDQFSRNLFRGTGRAFAADAMARSLAKRMVSQGLDVAMAREHRYFIYLPFEHSEDREDQSLAVSLIGQLGNDDWSKYALEHQSIINKFGRFPHRNSALGRKSRPEEMDFIGLDFSQRR